MKKLDIKTFSKYIVSAGISFLIDYSLFSLFAYFLKLSIGSKGIILATIMARVISSVINYLLNKNKVFNSNKNKPFDKETFIKYTFLVVFQMMMSAFIVYSLYNMTGIDEKIIKPPVEGVLFIVNYFVQKSFIFKKKN